MFEPLGKLRHPFCTHSPPKKIPPDNPCHRGANMLLQLIDFRHPHGRGFFAENPVRDGGVRQWFLWFLHRSFLFGKFP